MMTTVRFKFPNSQQLKRIVRGHWGKILAFCSALVVLAGVFVLIAVQNEDFVIYARSFFQSFDYQRLVEEYSDESTLYVDTTKADELYKKVRILCFVITTSSKLSKAVPVVNATWGRRCNKVLFVLCPVKDTDQLFLNTCHIREGSSHLMAKVRHAFKVSYDKYLNDYDWFLKADDDTYLVIENLRYVLSHHDPNDPGYLGYHFQKFMYQGYASGGAGYVISRKGLKQLVEKGFNMEEERCKTDGEIEDKFIGQCLEASGVPVLSSVDKFERQTFHTDKIWQHVWGTFPKYLVAYSRDPVKDGSNCCSQFLISFHHVDPGAMIFVHQLLYRTSVYGRNLPDDIPSNLFPGKPVPSQKVIDDEI
ncbi:glycoprotein-N-acetylgalactosamine 3-beta-galactosyltransferase 1-B-like [Saccostrea echinata]|uniref:glycoprotein-N-acetylgalactosamine 3-beta-galactosyltransferase 1-B-like n=1 Tax=Saccostrea echinata TaxID=191078 RepID=UPI002A7F0A12|nr:glycoprotein-N-acetylgalactosamine 3-beta-galactosyltransferase 1-B-like [Saccostrea echinata]